MSDPKFLAQLGDKLGDIDMTMPTEPEGHAAGPTAAAAAAPPIPEVENLLQAAK